MTDSKSIPRVESHTVRLSSGLRTHYRRQEGAGAPVLFLHGYVDSSYSFAALLESFPRRMQTFSLDFRGHGESDPAQSYAIADLVADSLEFMQHVIGEPAVIVGHSMGSIVAQRVAAQRPDLVLKLVLIGAAATARGHPALSALRHEIAKFAGVVPRRFIEEFQRSTVVAPVPEATIAGYIEESCRVAFSAWCGALDGLVNEPPGAAQSLVSPTLVLWGKNDSLFGSEAQEDLARLLPRHRFISYGDAGHAPHWEFPARVAADIDSFLDSH